MRVESMLYLIFNCRGRPHLLIIATEKEEAKQHKMAHGNGCGVIWTNCAPWVSLLKRKSTKKMYRQSF